MRYHFPIAALLLLFVLPPWFLPAEQQGQQPVAEITLLLLLTPEEAKKSFANVEFDNPVPSRL